MPTARALPILPASVCVAAGSRPKHRGVRAGICILPYRGKSQVRQIAAFDLFVGNRNVKAVAELFQGRFVHFWLGGQRSDLRRMRPYRNL